MDCARYHVDMARAQNPYSPPDIDVACSFCQKWQPAANFRCDVCGKDLPWKRAWIGRTPSELVVACLWRPFAAMILPIPFVYAWLDRDYLLARSGHGGEWYYRTPTSILDTFSVGQLLLGWCGLWAVLFVIWYLLWDHSALAEMDRDRSGAGDWYSPWDGVGAGKPDSAFRGRAAVYPVAWIMAVWTEALAYLRWRRQ